MLHSVKGKRYLLCYYTLESPWIFNDQPLVVLYFIDYQQIANDFSRLSRGVSWGIILFSFVLVLMMVMLSFNIVRPIRLLDEKVKEYSKNQNTGSFDIRRKDEIGRLNQTFFEMAVKINELLESLRKEAEVRERYRIQALRAQLNPHFLFNTLNTVRWMALISKADNIVDVINSLTGLLEYAIGTDEDHVSLKEELEIIRNYLHIQSYRYGENFELSLNIENNLENCRIIKFILQPIVENSFVHAFKNRSSSNMIEISVSTHGGFLKIRIRDNGNGMDGKRVRELNESLEGGNKPLKGSIGLFNVHERIRGEYGSPCGIHLESREGEGTLVEYTLPLLRDTA